MLFEGSTFRIRHKYHTCRFLQSRLVLFGDASAQLQVILKHRYIFVIKYEKSYINVFLAKSPNLAVFRLPSLLSALRDGRKDGTSVE